MEEPPIPVEVQEEVLECALAIAQVRNKPDFCLIHAEIVEKFQHELAELYAEDPGSVERMSEVADIFYYGVLSKYTGGPDKSIFQQMLRVFKTLKVTPEMAYKVWKAKYVFRMAGVKNKAAENAAVEEVMEGFPKK